MDVRDSERRIAVNWQMIWQTIYKAVKYKKGDVFICSSIYFNGSVKMIYVLMNGGVFRGCQESWYGKYITLESAKKYGVKMRKIGNAYKNINLVR